MGIDRMKLIFWFMRFVAPYRRQWYGILGLSIATALLGVLSTYASKWVVDDGIAARDLHAFLVAGLAAGGIFLVNALLAGLKEYGERFVRTRVEFDLNRYVFRHIQGLSLDWFREKTTGENLYVIDNDIAAVADVSAATLPQALFIFIKLVVTLAMVMYLNSKMAVFAVFLAAGACLPSYVISRRIQRNCEDLVKNAEATFQMLEEMFSHIFLIKIFRKEAASVRKYLTQRIARIRLSNQNIRWEIFQGATAELTSRISGGMIGLYGGYLVIRGQMSPGSLTAVMVYLYQLTQLQSQAVGFFEQFGVGGISCRRVKAILDEQPHVAEHADARNAVFLNGEVVFQGVSFGYAAAKRVIENVSITIPGKAHAALVGPSGCGKTTLLNLLLRLYDPHQGTISIDGNDLRGLTLRSLRGQIGYAAQQPLLWNESVEYNIRYGRPDASAADLLLAAELTGVTTVVKSLAQGFQTIIGENACRISEGQKQRIAISRALLRNPKILILDEALSSLDSASELQIMANIKHGCPSMTVIIVSHRLHAVMAADAAYYIVAPDRVVVDTPRKLLETNRGFGELFSGQQNSEPTGRA